jgi:ribosomal-protein-alanine N-acetyltransferase
MALADLPAVLEIDRLSFPTPSKAHLYQHELAENRLAHYQVLVCRKDGREVVLGHAGYWLLADEAHISTIAVRPDCRGRGLGELLLLNLLLEAYKLQAAIATLEVRRGNRVAQALYEKYRFELVGERRGYYRDTGEDALLMTVVLDAEYRSWLEKAFGEWLMVNG